MATIGALAVNIHANTGGLQRGLTKSRSLVSGFALAASAGAAAAVAGVTSIVRSYEQLNQSMTRSLAIMGNVSDGMRQQMTAAAIEVSKTTQFAAAQASEGFFFLASAGMDAEQSLRALPLVAKFAQAGNFDLARATDLLTDAQSALGLTSDDTATSMRNLARVSDVLVKANTMANASVAQFSEALTNKAGAALRNLNKDLEEGIAVLAAFADQGIKGNEAGSALAIILRDLTTRGIKNRHEFERLGAAVFDTTGKMRNVIDIVADLETVMDGASDAQKKMTLMQLGFTDKSSAFIQSLLGTTEKMREYAAGAREARDITDEIADKSLTTMQKQLNSLRGSWEQVSSTLGPFVVGPLAAAAGLTATLVTSYTEMARALTDLIGLTTPLEKLADVQERFVSHAERLAAVRGTAAAARDAAWDAINQQQWEKLVADTAAHNAELLANQNRIQALVDDAQRRVETFGMSDVDVAKHDLATNMWDRGLENQYIGFLEQLEKLGIARARDAELATQQAMAQERATAILAASRTPIERLRDDLEELDLLQRGGFLDIADWQRARERMIASAADSLGGQQQQRSLAVTERGSRAAFDHATGRKDKDMPTIAKNSQRQVDILSRMEKLIEQGALKPFADEPVVIKNHSIT